MHLPENLRISVLDYQQTLAGFYTTDYQHPAELTDVFQALVLIPDSLSFTCCRAQAVMLRRPHSAWGPAGWPVRSPTDPPPISAVVRQPAAFACLIGWCCVPTLRPTHLRGSARASGRACSQTPPRSRRPLERTAMI